MFKLSLLPCYKVNTGAGSYELTAMRSEMVHAVGFAGAPSEADFDRTLAGPQAYECDSQYQQLGEQIRGTRHRAGNRCTQFQSRVSMQSRWIGGGRLITVTSVIGGSTVPHVPCIAERLAAISALFGAMELAAVS